MDELEQMRIDEENEILKAIRNGTFSDYVLQNEQKFDKHELARILSEFAYYSKESKSRYEIARNVVEALEEYGNYGKVSN